MVLPMDPRLLGTTVPSSTFFTSTMPSRGAVIRVYPRFVAACFNCAEERTIWVCAAASSSRRTRS